ncbi:MAG: hypothetical protein KA715_07430, partial [Xanthomonadaceae bacterium]|nr:hypothetical protein [Xanthomonadaceae bacterium]
DAFYNAYVLRESFNRPILGDWHEALVGLLCAFIMPWGLLMLGARVRGFFRARDWSNETRYAVSFGVPLMMFFTFYLYRGQSYGMYLVGVLFFWMFTRLPERVFPFQRYFAILLIVPITLAFLIQFYFKASAEWWQPTTFYLVAALSILGGAWTWRQRSAIPAMAAFLVSASTMSAQLGERELVGPLKHPSQTFYYYSIHQGIWSEWGYMNYALKKKIIAIHTEDDLTKYMLTGGALLVPGLDAENQLKEQLNRLGFKWDECVTGRKPWKKWKTRGADNQGNTYFSLATRNRNLSYLERDNFILDTRACRKYR